MNNWDKYMNSRMLKHAGLLRESIYANPKEELIDVYSDTYKSAYGMRPRSEDFSKYSEEQLQAMIDELRAEVGESTQARITHESSAAAQYEGKTRVTKAQLQRIIKEEVSRVIKEMEIVNADSGEVLTVDQLPPKYAGRLTKDESGYDALYDQDFEALRQDLTLDPDEALGMLEGYAAEEMGAAGGDLGTAIDIAMGFKMSYPKEWKAALTTQRVKDMYYEDDEMEFETINDALARFLAERMG